MIKPILKTLPMWALLIISTFRIILGELQIPQFTLQYSIMEQKPIGYQIGRLKDDLLKMPEVRATNFYYKLQSGGGRSNIQYILRDPSDYFSLDPNGGILSTSNVLDLESLCEQFCRDDSDDGQMNVFVNLLFNRNTIAVIQVQITIMDVDDNAPEFPTNIPRPYVLSLKEVIYRTGKQVEIPKAVDKDVKLEHTEIAYRLEAHPEDKVNSLKTFHLIVRDDLSLVLELQRELDYEDVKLYRFYLVAWSPKTREGKRLAFSNLPDPEFQDRLEILVKVRNINDIGPVFPNQIYNTEIIESTPVKASIIKVSDLSINNYARHS